MVDLHKEIKLSDLFKRKPKETAEGAEKPPKPPKERKPRKERKPKKQVAVAAREAPPVPAIPLMRAFNLLPSEETRQQAEGRGPLPQVLVALAGVLVLAALAAFYLMAATDATEKKSAVDDLRAELAAYQVSKKPKPQDKTAALAEERVGRTTALSAALGTRLAWDRVLRELALILPDDSTIDSIEATAPAAYNAPAPPVDGSPVVHFTMVGGTDSQASVAELLARLSVIPEFSNVALKVSKRAEAAEGTRHPYLFTITATLRLGS